MSIKGEETSKKPPSLRAKLSWFSHFHALSVQAGVFLSHSPDKSCSLQKPVGRVAKVWVQGQLEGAVGSPHQGGVEPLCCAHPQLHLLQLRLAWASLKSYLIQSGMLLSRIMGESGSDIKGYRHYRCAQKEGKQRMEKE